MKQRTKVLFILAAVAAIAVAANDCCSNHAEAIARQMWREASKGLGKQKQHSAAQLTQRIGEAAIGRALEQCGGNSTCTLFLEDVRASFSTAVTAIAAASGHRQLVLLGETADQVLVPTADAACTAGGVEELASLLKSFASDVQDAAVSAAESWLGAVVATLRKLPPSPRNHFEEVAARHELRAPAFETAGKLHAIASNGAAALRKRCA